MISGPVNTPELPQGQAEAGFPLKLHLCLSLPPYPDSLLCHPEVSPETILPMDDLLGNSQLRRNP